MRLEMLQMRFRVCFGNYDIYAEANDDDVDDDGDVPVTALSAAAAAPGTAPAAPAL